MKKNNELYYQSKNVAEKYASLEFPIIILLFIVFITLSVFYIFTLNNIFPLLSALILVTHFFIFKGRYRVYSLLFYSSFNSLMMMINTSVGSFFTWSLILYALIIFLEHVITQREFNDIGAKVTATSLIFLIYMLIINLINIKSIRFVQFFSLIAYLISIPMVYVDFRADKNRKKIIFSLVLGIISANLFGLVFAYVLPSMTENFLIVTAERLLRSFLVNRGNYRFSGVLDDPNFNGMTIMLSIALLSANINFVKRKYLLAVLSIPLVMFGFLGQSKSFVIVLSIIIIAFLINYLRSNKRIAQLSILAILLAFFLLLIFGQSIVISVLQRFLTMDTREGILNGITTGRINIQIAYIINMLNNPIQLIFGHGTSASYLPEGATHNFILGILWEYGFVGSIFYIIYMATFFSKDLQVSKNSFHNTLFLLVILIYSFSLDLKSNPLIYLYVACLFLTNTTQKIVTQQYEKKKRHPNIAREEEAVKYYETTI